MAAIHDHLADMLRLLEVEKEEDLRQYALKMQDTSLAERRKRGVCWFPLMVEDSRYATGERVIVTVRRPAKYQEAHSFQSGKLVSLFIEGEQTGQVNGVINQASRDTMTITLNSDDIPRWLTKGQLGVQLLFDEATYKEMRKAIKRLIKTEEPHTIRLAKIILGSEQPTFDEANEPAVSGLNASQNTALRNCLNAHDLALIHGPPGTGKTTTLVEVIYATVATGEQVLVCAPSNTAVDLLVEKLSEKGLNVLRLGHPARVTEEMLGATLDARLTRHDDYDNLKKLRKKADEHFSLAKKYKRNFSRIEREQRRMLFDEAHQYKDAAEQLHFYIMQDIVKTSHVIACTPVAANNRAIKHLSFQTVFIDEASQALEPATWIPMLKAKRVIFAGDHYQLPPTVKSDIAAKEGLGITLFERAMKHQEASTLLLEQYRMNEVIMGFSNREFYDNQLLAHDSVAHHTMFEGDAPLVFIDTAGTGFEELLDTETRSRYNEGEITILESYLTQYLEHLGSATYDIGLIAPYKAQVEKLREHFSNHEHRMDINTVDGFQGQERDIIMISLVRSNDKGEIGFLADERRLNVALTRARKKLVVIGDSATIGQHQLFADFLDYAQQRGEYRSAYEWM